MSGKLTNDQKQKLELCLKRLDKLSNTKDIKKQKEILKEITTDFANVSVDVVEEKKIKAKKDRSKDSFDHDIEAEENANAYEFIDAIKNCIDCQQKCIESYLILLENAPDQYSRKISKLAVKNSDMKRTLKNIMKGIVDTL